MKRKFKEPVFFFNEVSMARNFGEEAKIEDQSGWSSLWNGIKSGNKGERSKDARSMAL